jgi:hypothetical protein
MMKYDETVRKMSVLFEKMDGSYILKATQKVKYKPWRHQNHAKAYSRELDDPRNEGRFFCYIIIKTNYRARSLSILHRSEVYNRTR